MPCWAVCCHRLRRVAFWVLLGVAGVAGAVGCLANQASDSGSSAEDEEEEEDFASLTVRSHKTEYGGPDTAGHGGSNKGAQRRESPDHC